MLTRKMLATQPVRTSRLPAFRAEHFPYSGPYPWLDLPDAAEAIAARLAAGAITPAEAEICRYWMENGYVILPGLIDPGTVDSVWGGYERAIAAGRIQLEPEPAAAGDPHPGRYLNPHKKAPGSFCRILKHPGLHHWLRVLIGHDAKALQTIASHKGSQQGIHSDSIHMTTYPLGYLTAAWIACEDIHPDSGPLVYYPGSHRLPYLFSRDAGISVDDFRRDGYRPYHDRYEPMIVDLIAKHRLEPACFQAKKGDVLIWHANLLHGGSPRRDLALTRKAIVCHFFAKGSFVYHDLAAARSRQQYIGTCMLRDESGSLLGLRGKSRT